MITDPYESWLAKQAAKGRRPPITTAPYYPPKNSTVVTVTEDGATVVTECE